MSDNGAPIEFYHKNPRQITDQQFENLERWLEELGDLSGVVHDLNSNQIIGGNQRGRIFDINECEIQLDEVYDQLDEQGTVALGHVIWKEFKYTYRQVRWTEYQCEMANIVANKAGGEWDFDALANKFKLDDLLDWGFIEHDLDLDLWLSEPTDENRGALNARFVVPPFTILDTRQGYWQERKTAWLSFGIESEIGRDVYSGADANMFIGSTQARPTNITSELRPSIFDPVLCEIAYRWFCPLNSKIIDPFAGGSVRGIVASILGHDYIGVDLSITQIDANKAQAEDLLDNNKPVWVVGNSANIKTLAPGEYDFIFSCPPYYDLEVYGDNEGELSALSNYEEFITIYRQIISECVSMLKDNRFACFVVGDIRDDKGIYRRFPADTVKAFCDAGMVFYNDAVLLNRTGTVAMQVAHNFPIGRKLGKLHQNVLVFYKGDPKMIKQFGDVDVGMPEDWVDMTGGDPHGIEEPSQY